MSRFAIGAKAAGGVARAPGGFAVHLASAERLEQKPINLHRKAHLYLKARVSGARRLILGIGFAHKWLS